MKRWQQNIETLTVKQRNAGCKTKECREPLSDVDDLAVVGHLDV